MEVVVALRWHQDSFSAC